MIPSDVRLFTWLDVEEVIARAVAEQTSPAWLVRASAYWDELKISVLAGNEEGALDWIRQLFDPRTTNIEDGHTLGIALEGLNGAERLLPVVVEEADQPFQPRPLSPTFSRPPTIEPGRSLARPQEILGAAPIAAFHSFKGGVGRTTHAIRLALAASEKHRVLLIDADVEAPGISWLVRRRLPEPPVAFSDLIALAHGDTSQEHRQTVEIVADRLRNALIDGCFILPAFRNLRRLPSLEIRPDHLVIGQSDPFVLTRIISAVGRELHVGLVVVDLRAGYSEMAAGLLLDPRVHRVFVTTLSGQALEGTVELLEVLGSRAPSREEYEPYPAVVVSQVPDGLRREDWSDTFDRLVEARSRFMLPSVDPTEDPLILESGFDRALQMTPADWEGSSGVLRRSPVLSEATNALLAWLPLGGQAHVQVAETSLAGSIEERRHKLRQSAQQMIFAERRIEEGFLATGPLRAFAGDNISQLPIGVIVGAKGSGKTFTFLQQVRLRSWKNFVEAAIGRSPDIDAILSPTLFSINLGEEALKDVSEARRQASQSLTLEAPMSSPDINDVIRGRLSVPTAEAVWRDLWLDCIAWAVGFKPHVSGAGRQLADRLDRLGQHLIGLFDGLEDLFQEIATNPAQQLALRTLLQDVPLWLSQRPLRSLGVLVFIRRDLVSLAVRQNHAQLLDRYLPYALQWDRGEALRLADWVRSKALDISTGRPEVGEEELRERLVTLWGRKLGSDESREARSADWVLNALSDYNNQIQARDLVRFISVAAAKSISDKKWPDRDLAPPAIREALPECSREKILEIKKENEALKKVFEKMERIPQPQRLLPFDASFAELAKEDFRILEENGALFNDSGSYYLPEIYLHGLGFSYTTPGRRRVLSNRRK